MTKPVDELEASSWVLVPWDLGLMSTISTEIIKSWYPLAHMSVNHEVISGSASIYNGVEMENNSQSWFFHLFVLWRFFFFGGKSWYPQSCKIHRLCLAKSEHIKSSPFYVNDEEGPWLGGELTQMGTGGLLISSLRQFVYLSNLDLNGWVFTT